MELIVDRIKQIADNENIKITPFEESIGASKGVLSRAIKNHTDIQSKWITSIIENYPQYRSEWLLTGKGSMLKSDQEIIPIHKGKTDREVESQEVPLYELVTTLGVNEIFAESNLTVPLDYIRIPNLPKCDGALYARGDSMYPLLKSGDILLYKVVNDIQNIIWGEMYMCHIVCNGDEFFFTKFVKKSEKEGFATFISQNQHHQPIEFPIDCIQSLALVKATIRINSQI